MHGLLEALEAEGLLVGLFGLVQYLLDAETLYEGRYHLAQGFEGYFVRVCYVDCVFNFSDNLAEFALMVGFVFFPIFQAFRNRVIQRSELVFHTFLHLVRLFSE